MTLLLRVRRYRCHGAAGVWREDTDTVAAPRAKLSRHALAWALEAIAIDHLTVTRVAAGLEVSWHTANMAVLAEGKRVRIDDLHRFEGVSVIGVDEQVWRHTRRGDRYVTVIIDLTPVRQGRGPSRLLDMVERPLEGGVQDLARRPPADLARWGAGGRDGRVHRLQGRHHRGAPGGGDSDGPFHVVRIADEAVDVCRHRIPLLLHGHHGRAGDPLYSCRRTLHAGAGLLTDRQAERDQALLADDRHTAVEAT